ncbi:immunity 51 family protein [Streptomyces sp. PTM05]|uniref:Immunity 51 family protein n=1 Tax=Streptantibioticus parmotrematis TaxID=2873249 RepID=A0ABS7QVV1_9ACTN|nr:Imm51 family immunity protein [Streptantibioticus parmotrematis]MBY8887336.1 immunity 51 family protein [Streptantibioticus parmotrematis]
MMDRTTYAPLLLAEYGEGSGSYYLMLTDDAMASVMDAFAAAGGYGNGYGWHGVARSAVRADAPDLADRLAYDPEAGTLVVRSDDVEALRRVATLLSSAYHDRSRLAELIRTGDPADFD